MKPELKAALKNPGVIAFLAVIVVANFVVDWLWFKPENVVAFLIAGAAVVCGIVLAVSRKARDRMDRIEEKWPPNHPGRWVP